MTDHVKPRAAAPGADQRTARHDEIARLYLAGMRIADIAAQTGVSTRTVTKVVRRRRLPQRSVANAERDRSIVKRYAAGDPVSAIAAAHDTTSPNIRRIAARAGIPARSGWQRRYPIDESVFDDPSPIGWWLIGLLAADGSINAAEHRISLCQTLDDADVLYEFYAHLGCPDRPLTILRLSEAAQARQWKRKPAAEARVFSRRLVEALARHGVVPRKAASMRLSTEASQEPAVWLGVLDGDGTVGLWTARRTPHVAFSGSRMLMEQCARFWKNALGVGKRPFSANLHSGRTWTVGLSGDRAVAAAAMLLKASPVSHRRKRALLQQIAGWKPHHPLRAGSSTTIVSLERRQSQ